MALLLRRELGVDVIFNLATRDMNRLALSVHLLSAVALGLENVVVLRGDDFAARDQGRVAAVHDTAPTHLLELAAMLNAGRDFRGTALAGPVPICAGATMDFGRAFEREVRLAVRKVRAGARFFLTQSITDATLPERFAAAYRAETGEDLSVPVLWGVPVLAPGSIAFGQVPEAWARDLEAGRPGADIARDFLDALRARGVEAIYLIAPILRGGERDYAEAARVLASLAAA
jgi:homocysteine S-methyltransferase